MEEDIEEFLEEKNAEKVDLISLLRTFKKEGLENFVVIRVKKLENLLKAYKEKEIEIKKDKETIAKLSYELGKYQAKSKEDEAVIEELKERLETAKDFIIVNSNEFLCERDNGIPELKFNDNTNSSDLLDILAGNY